MITTTIYESEDGIVRVKPHLYQEGKIENLAYITIYAGRDNNFIHVNEKYLVTLADILNGLANIYKLDGHNQAK